MSGDVSMSERRLLFSQSLPALSIYIFFLFFSRNSLVVYRLDLSGSNSTAFTERIIGLYLFWLLVFGELLYVLLLLMILSFRSYGQLAEEMLSFHQGFRQFFFFFFPNCLSQSGITIYSSFPINFV